MREKLFLKYSCLKNGKCRLFYKFGFHHIDIDVSRKIYGLLIGFLS